jgi:ABC-type Mn2+/Zn2+ transport system permease subunit
MDTAILFVLILGLILALCATSGFYSRKWWERDATFGILMGLVSGYVLTRTSIPLYPAIIGVVTIFLVVKILFRIASKGKGDTPFGVLTVIFGIGTALSCIFPTENQGYFYAFVALCIGVEWIAYTLRVRLNEHKEEKLLLERVSKNKETQYVHEAK